MPRVLLMPTKRLLALSAALLSVAIAGCDKAEDGTDGSVGVLSLFDPVAANPSLCGAPAIPYPNNALFADGTSPTGLTPDATLNIPSTASTALAANLTDGFSTTASIFTDVLGAVDYDTVSGAVVILEADATPRILVPGVDYTIQPSIAMAQVSGTGGCAIDAAANTLPAKFQPISQQRSRILIEPLKPLAASTTYIVAVTKNLLSRDGIPAKPNEFFPLVNSDTKLCKLSGAESGTELACSDPNAPAAAATATGAVVLNFLAPPPTCPTCTSAAVKLATLETLRRNLVRPTVSAFKSLANALRDPDIADSDLVIAWSFTTQSISATLATVNAIATAKTFSVGAVPNAGAGDLDSNGRLGTGELGIAGLANTADIFVGTFNAVPYYLDDASSTTDAASQGGFWLNNGTVTTGASAVVPFLVADFDGNPATPSTPAPCAFFTTVPTSTTNCYRIPLERSTENLPIMITVPKTAKPTSGWPVVIFQHGITGNRTQMLPIGAALASAGFVTVAIDLPLHGLIGPASPTNPFYTSVERTFDLDLVNNTSGAPPGGDGTDPSGTHFINLSSLITSRDNLRQAVADLIHLTRSLGAADPMNLDGAAGDDIDETRIYFSGISLGGIVGTTLLGVNTEIKAASLSVPGGGVAKLLDASASFGPRIAAGLAGVAFSTALSGVSSPFEGTDTYETFVRFAQHLVDPGDPINFAVAANANHRIHLTEVIGDTVVPNEALTTCPAPGELTLGIGATAISNAVADTRQAACLAAGALVGSNSTTAALCPGIVTTGVCASSASQDETLISGYLSGTEPLFGEMGLTVTGPLTPPGTAANQSNVDGLDVAVQFAVGTHGSLLTPAGPGGATQFLAVTCEMQRQTVTYLASNGTQLQVGGTCP